MHAHLICNAKPVCELPTLLIMCKRACMGVTVVTKTISCPNVLADNTVNGPTPYHQTPRVAHDHDALWWSNDPCCDCMRDSAQKSDSPPCPANAPSRQWRAGSEFGSAVPSLVPSPSPTQSSSAITLSVAADLPLNSVGRHPWWGCMVSMPMIHPGIIGQVATFQRARHSLTHLVFTDSCRQQAQRHALGCRDRRGWWCCGRERWAE